MAKLSKRKKLILEKVDSEKQYSIEEAVSLIKEISTVKFEETIDVAVNLGIDPRKSDQAVRGATSLPHGTGKTLKPCLCSFRRRTPMCRRLSRSRNPVRERLHSCSGVVPLMLRPVLDRYHDIAGRKDRIGPTRHQRRLR